MILNFLLFLLLISFAFGADILAILPTPSYSHQIAYRHIWKELSLRGHKVTLMTTDPLKDPKLTNLTEIDMKWTYEVLKNINVSMQNDMTMWNAHYPINNFNLQIAEAQLSHPDIQNLIHNKSHFDVVLVEFIFPEFLAFAEIYNCPKIIFCSLDTSAILHSSFGNTMNPVLYPDIGATFFGHLSFKERITSTLYTWYSSYFFKHVAFESKTELVKKYINVSKTVSEMIRDTDMLFINVNPILQPIRALGPSTITIGGYREEVQSTSLQQDLAEFLDTATNGFVYFSLGSNVKSKDLIKESREAITEVLGELPYKVLWKFEADELPNKPKNVKLIKWAPQQAILSHPNIKVFVTQGGLQSFEEGLYREVPFVVIPFFADQEQNAKIMESKGIAVIVNRIPSINKVELKNAILEVIENPRYRNTVKRLKQLALDFPMTGLEKAIWWTEYVIRNKGAKHLRNPAADLPFYQYYLIDVVGFLVLSVIATFLVSYVILRIIYKLASRCIYVYILRKEKRE